MPPPAAEREPCRYRRTRIRCLLALAKRRERSVAKTELLNLGWPGLLGTDAIRRLKPQREPMGRWPPDERALATDECRRCRRSQTCNLRRKAWRGIAFGPGARWRPSAFSRRIGNFSRRLWVGSCRWSARNEWLQSVHEPPCSVTANRREDHDPIGPRRNSWRP